MRRLLGRGALGAGRRNARGELSQSELNWDSVHMLVSVSVALSTVNKPLSSKHTCSAMYASMYTHARRAHTHTLGVVVGKEPRSLGAHGEWSQKTNKHSAEEPRWGESLIVSSECVFLWARSRWLSESSDLIGFAARRRQSGWGSGCSLWNHERGKPH